MIRSPGSSASRCACFPSVFAMAAATPQGIGDKVIRFTSWDIQPEEVYAKRMRTLRQLCVDTDDSCRDQFFKVLCQVDDWEWEDMNLQKLPQDKHVSNRTEKVLKAFSLGQLVQFQSPPPGTASVGSAAAAASGRAMPATGWPTTPGDTLERVFNDEAQQKAELIERNRASAIALRAAKMAADQQSTVSQAVEEADVFPFRAASGSWL